MGPALNVAVAQLDPIVGNIDGNAAGILDAWCRARDAGADLVVTPELSLTGYPPRDLLDRPELGEAVERALAALARQTADGPALIVGAPLPTPHADAKPLQNCAVWLDGGQVIGRRAKTLLPTYDVFDDARYFEPARVDDLQPIVWRGRRVALTICEDLWNDRELWPSRRYAVDPMEVYGAAGVDLVINVSASPYRRGKRDVRHALLQQCSKRWAVPVIYANQTGGHDELLFDGASVIYGPGGEPVASAAMFATDLLLHTFDPRDLDRHGTHAEPPHCHEAEVYAALVMGVRDYFRKTGFARAVLGLSGGIDSALTAVVAADALGADNVLGITMPSRYSSGGSVTDSEHLAQRLGLPLWTLPIEGPFAAFLDLLEAPFDGAAPDVTEENIQARTRGVLVMAAANKGGRLALATGNKSELAVGYCTMYGDMCGALSVLGDVPKTMVYRIARWLNRNGERIPNATIEKPPSAELAPGQKDADSLPPYDVLDPILEARIEDLKTADQIVDMGFERPVVERILRMIDRTEYKRWQAAPSLRVSKRAFGCGRRMPLAAKSP